MRSWLMSLAVVAVSLIGSDVMAQGCATCGNGGGSGGHWSGPPQSHLGKRGGVALQAAPWYLYWPYDAHFQTPAPVYGAYSPPPYMNGYPSQPFFPSHSYGYPYVPGSPLNIYPYGPTVAPGYAQ